MNNSTDQPTPPPPVQAPAASESATPAPPMKGDSTHTAPQKTPTRTPPRLLPRWKVLLHNDDVNDMEYIVITLQDIVHLNQQDATLRTLEAHKTGVSLLLTTHQELAELYQQQFTSKNLTVTIEPAE